MISSKWDYDLIQLKDFLNRLINTTTEIQLFEEKLTKVYFISFNISFYLSF